MKNVDPLASTQTVLASLKPLLDLGTLSFSTMKERDRNAILTGLNCQKFRQVISGLRSEGDLESDWIVIQEENLLNAAGPKGEHFKVVSQDEYDRDLNPVLDVTLGHTQKKTKYADLTVRIGPGREVSTLQYSFGFLYAGFDLLKKQLNLEKKMSLATIASKLAFILFYESMFDPEKDLLGRPLLIKNTEHVVEIISQQKRRDRPTPAVSLVLTDIPPVIQITIGVPEKWYQGAWMGLSENLQNLLWGGR